MNGLSKLKISLRQKLLFPLLLILIVLTVAGYYSIKIADKILIDSVGQQATGLVDQAMDKIDQMIYFRIQEAKIISRDPTILEAVQESNQEFEKLTDRGAYLDQKNKEWKSLPKEGMNQFMRDIINSPASQELRNTAKFNSDIYGYDVISKIFISNKFGANVAQSVKTEYYRHDDKDWWQKAKKDGIYVSDVIKDEAKSTGLDGMMICVRLEGDKGEFLGVVKFFLNVRQITDTLKELERERWWSANPKISNPVQFRLVNKDYRYIYSTGKYKIGDKLDGDLIKKISQKRGTLYWFDKGRLFVYCLSDGFKSYKGHGWILLMEFKTQDMMASLYKLKSNIVVLLFSIFVFLIFISRQIYKWMVLPLVQLEKSAMKLGEGQWDAPMQVKSNDEIGRLAETFNGMAIKLKESHRNLEEKIQEIDSTNKKLKTTYEMQKDFTSTVSHELRTPLASIKMGIDLVENKMLGEINPQQQEALGHVKSNVDRLKRLIDDILDLTKIESGKLKMNFMVNDIHKVIKEVIETQSQFLEARGLYLKTDFDGAIEPIAFDSDRIIQVLNNLISNAVKFTKQGGITIKTKNNPTQKNILVSVKDTGKGISEWDLPKLFQKFQQIESAQDNETGGTGLGLVICKEIITRHGGTIWVESKQGEGASFNFTLPLKEWGAEL